MVVCAVQRQKERTEFRGEIGFGALQTGLDIEYSRTSIGFTW
jgi:hypothetical protein